MSTKHCRRARPSLSVLVFSGLVWFGCSGCGLDLPHGPPRKQTFPVTGVVVVDGQPVEMLEVACHDVKLIGTDGSMVVAAYTDAKGKFELSSYQAGDGVPEGDYVVTFSWGEINLISRSYGGPDKLKDRYKSPQESKVKFTAKKGTPVDLGKIVLITK